MVARSRSTVFGKLFSRAWPSLGPAPSTILLFLWGFGLCLSCGRVGFMPLDQSIVFDGAWRLLSGQVPFRDFTTPDGLTPMVLQVLFFKVFGITWFAYCLHAALFNGLFCCLTYGLLRTLGSSGMTAVVYGALSGVVFYPPFGTPFREQHAFFFSLLVILMAVVATGRPRGRAADLLWLLVPFAFAAGYFSKQIPTILVLPVLLLCLLVGGRDRAFRALLVMGMGTTLVAAILVTVAWVNQVEWELVRVYFFELPAATGKGRLRPLLEPGLALTRLIIEGGYSHWYDPGINVLLVPGLLVPAWYAFLSHPADGTGRPRWIPLGLTTAVLLAAAMGGLLLEYRWGNAWMLGEIGVGLVLLTGCGVVLAVGQGQMIRDVRSRLQRALATIVLAAAMALICLAVALLSWQEHTNTLALVYASLGIAQTVLMGAAVSVARCIKNPGRRGRTLRSLVLALPWMLAVLAAVQAEHFHRAVNVGRTVHQQQSVSSRNLKGSLISPRLSFLVWDVPAAARHGASPEEHAEAVRRTLAFLRGQDANFVLIGDSSILYALTGRPSVSPSVWFHPGLTIPLAGTEAFEGYQHRLIENMDRHGVRFVVLEGERTWVDTRLSSFPLVEELVWRRGVGTYRFTPFTIVELSKKR